MSEMIRVYLEMNDRTSEVSLSDGSTVEDLLRLGKLHPDAYIITRSSRPVPLTSKLLDGDRLKFIKVASGG
jgi:sulfur carrier protein ThiS